MRDDVKLWRKQEHCLFKRRSQRACGCRHADDARIVCIAHATVCSTSCPFSTEWRSRRLQIQQNGCSLDLQGSSKATRCHLTSAKGRRDARMLHERAWQVWNWEQHSLKCRHTHTREMRKETTQSNAAKNTNVEPWRGKNGKGWREWMRRWSGMREWSVERRRLSRSWRALRPWTMPLPVAFHSWTHLRGHCHLETTPCCSWRASASAGLPLLHCKLASIWSWRSSSSAAHWRSRGCSCHWLCCQISKGAQVPVCRCISAPHPRKLDAWWSPSLSLRFRPSKENQTQTLLSISEQTNWRHFHRRTAGSHKAKYRRSLL